MSRYIYLIEVEGDGRWTPMYAPCYSKQEAEKKRKVKARLFGLDRVRVSVWQWIGSQGSAEAPRIDDLPPKQAEG